MPSRDYPASQAAELTIMAILADVIAGTTRARVIDRASVYAAIANAPGSPVPAGNLGVVVPLTYKGIAVDQMPLRRLIDLRKREAREGGDGLRSHRHACLAAGDDNWESCRL